MEYRSLGKTGLKLSLLGLGGFHLLEVGVETVGKMVKKYIDAGGNYFETARSYGDGDSERKLSNFLPEEGVIVATKTGERTFEGSRRQL
ncbi:MAG TPA: aldo/keto reductase, partial [Mesotoga infera]|nr:aldo/keto reductase [Mesotoga infera]